jgi:hypothetical protein
VRSSPGLFASRRKKGWESWETEIEADSPAGRFDFLEREGLEEKTERLLRVSKGALLTPR